jgi:8-oxo-dGTP pyrophosphatase MutT (NUDIX family)
MSSSIFLPSDSEIESDEILNEVANNKDSANSCKVLIWSVDPFTKKKVYLLQRGGNGQWGFPGGHVRVNEPFEEGAVREVYEEIGIKIDPKAAKLILVTQRSNKRDKRGYVYFFEYEHTNFLQIPTPQQLKPDSKKFNRPEVMEVRWINSLQDLNCLEWAQTDSYVNMISRNIMASRFKNRTSDEEVEYQNKVKKGVM